MIILSLCIAILCTCGGEGTASTDGQDIRKTAVAHDHDGDGIPDHAPGKHDKKAVPHDHDGDGVPDHGPGAHGQNEQHPDPNHPSNDKNVKGEWITDEEAAKRNAEIERKQEEAKKQKPTTEQKATGDKICQCLTDLNIFNKTISAKSQEEFNILAGDASADEVKKMQICHTQYMKAAIRTIPEKTDRSIFGFKAREHIAKKCLRGNEQFWFYMGKYVSERTSIDPK